MLTEEVKQKMRVKLATGLAFLVIFMMLTSVDATPVLEFVDVPDRVKLEDSFTFSVKLTDARDYDYFSLYGETPSGEEMYFGEHRFDEGLWFVYSNEWTLNFSAFDETGYYTLSVDAGSLRWVEPDVEKITASCSIYVEEATVETTINGISPFWWVESVRIIAIYFVIGGVFLMLGYAAWKRKKKRKVGITEIDAPIKPLPLDRERIATVCALCVWVVALALCWSFLTDMSLLPYDRESAFTYLMMSFFAMAIFFISVLGIVDAISNLYEHR